MNEQRATGLRRQVNSLAMRGGEVEESKLWAQLGKSLCAWLIYKHADALINHWEVLLVLLAWLIAPEIAKKAITMKFGSGTGTFTEHTESTSRVTTASKEVAKVDNPDGK